MCSCTSTCFVSNNLIQIFILKGSLSFSWMSPYPWLPRLLTLERIVDRTLFDRGYCQIILALLWVYTIIRIRWGINYLTAFVMLYTPLQNRIKFMQYIYFLILKIWMFMYSWFKMLFKNYEQVYFRQIVFVELVSWAHIPRWAFVSHSSLYQIYFCIPQPDSELRGLYMVFCNFFWS